MNICMVGSGAFAKKHLDGLARIKDAKVVSLHGRTAETTKAVAEKYGIPHWTTNFDEAVNQPGVEAVILTFVEAIISGAKRLKSPASASIISAIGRFKQSS